MSSDDNFFAMPPPEGEAPPVPEGESAHPDGDFTMVGEAPPAEAPPMVGDIDESPPADMGFAGEPSDMGFAGDTNDAFATDMGFAGDSNDAFAAPPSEYEAAPDSFAAPPNQDAPIILGGGPTEVEEGSEPDEATPVEASAMQKWNEEWQETLTARKDEENTKKAEMIEAARLTMETFAKDRETKRDTKMSKNREDEQAKLEAIEADLENDNSWQRACKMVELSHDGANDTEDVKRMRDVLILLKNEPSRAASVGA
jgi:hypothetical protein